MDRGFEGDTGRGKNTRRLTRDETETDTQETRDIGKTRDVRKTRKKTQKRDTAGERDTRRGEIGAWCRLARRHR